MIPPGPSAAREAEKTRTRLLSQVDERRNPRTRATMNQLLDKYLEVLDVDASTRRSYVGYINNHIRPLLGRLVDRFELATWQQLVDVLLTTGPEGLIEAVRAAERSDPAGQRWPRGKVHDDATAAIVHV